MAETREFRRVPLSEWQAQSLRVTGFPVPLPVRTDHQWWATLVGEAPATTTSQPRTGQHLEQGDFLGGVLLSHIQPTRVDWVLSSRLEDIGATIVPMLGGFVSTLEPFAELVARWLGLETCPTLQRLALGVVLVLPVKSRHEGYGILSAYLPSVTLDAETSSDFLYQINRPRESSLDVQRLRINRLSKWSVGTGQWMNLALEPTGPAQAVRGEPSLFCRLELDINTAPELQGPLPQGQLAAVLQELVETAVEIATKGDIP